MNPESQPKKLDAFVITLLDDCTVMETPAVDYQPGQHGSVFVAMVRPNSSDLHFFQWKHGPLSSVETMRVIYANTYGAVRQFSFKLSDVAHTLLVSPSDITYSDLEQYAQMVLAQEHFGTWGVFGLGRAA